MKILIAVLILSSFVGAQDTVQDAVATNPLEVEVVIAKIDKLTATRVTSVTIGPAVESKVTATTAAPIAEILKRKNQKVTSGEAIIKLDTKILKLQVQSAQLDIERAQVELLRAQQASKETINQTTTQLQFAQKSERLAQKQYQEGLELYEIGIISRNELTNIETQLDQAKANLSQIQGDLARSQRAGTGDLELLYLQVEQARNQLAQLQVSLDSAVVTAPFNGEIVEFFVTLGESVQDGTPLFHIISTTEQVARFNVPVDIADSLEAEGLVWIKHGGLDYAAQVITVSHVAVDTQLVEVIAQLYDSKTRIPNGTVAQLPYVYTIGEGVLLPVDALQHKAGKSYVYIAKDGKAQHQEVNVLAGSEDKVQVKGIAEGVEVVSPVSSGLFDGLEIKVLSSSKVQSSGNENEYR